MPKKSGPNATSKLDRLLAYQHVLAAFTRIAGEALSPERLLQHATAQVSSVTQISRVKVLRYRPDHGDLLIEAGVGWKPGVVGQVSMSIDRASFTGSGMTPEGSRRECDTAVDPAAAAR